jgi:hypothetical protein
MLIFCHRLLRRCVVPFSKTLGIKTLTQQNTHGRPDGTRGAITDSSKLSIVRKITVRSWVSGKALAAGILGDPQPVASAIPLTYSSNDAKMVTYECSSGRATPAG